jgi:hypothetical protein
MPQALHIFGKDVRRSWPEILIACGALAAYVNEQPHLWVQRPAFSMLQVLASYLGALVPLTWLFLITRVVQAESLVGDRQFWVTRPYRWPQLLASKLLFIFVFLNVPFFIADILLLRLAGFPPWRYIGGLLWMQLLMSAFFFLACLALATVTATLAQMALTIAILVLYLIGMGFLSEAFPHSRWSDHSETLLTVIFLGCGVAVVLWQYARRHTWRARGIVAAAVVSMTMVEYALPDNAAAIIARDYPQQNWQASPVRLAFDTTPPKEPKIVPRKERTILVTLPLRVSDATDDVMVSVDGLLLTVAGRDGRRWSSGWHRWGDVIVPEQSQLHLSFPIPATFMGEVQSTPADVQIEFALTTLRQSNPHQLILPPGEFPLAGGLCFADANRQESIECRFPLHGPQRLAARTESSASTCPPIPEATSPPRATAWTMPRWNNGSSPAEFGISPIEEFWLFFFYPQGRVVEPRRLGARVCPGTPITFFEPEPDGRSHTTLQIPGVTLWRYRESNDGLGGAATGWSVRVR